MRLKLMGGGVYIERFADYPREEVDINRLFMEVELGRMARMITLRLKSRWLKVGQYAGLVHFVSFSSNEIAVPLKDRSKRRYRGGGDET